MEGKKHLLYKSLYPNKNMEYLVQAHKCGFKH